MMGYCTSCGAYIPDGQTACLACGFDEAAGAKSGQSGSDSARAYSFSNDELREKLERQRAEQRERNRQWAEQEKERREKQQQNRQWAEEEYARRQAERERQAESYVNRSSSVANDRTAAGDGNKLFGALSYLSFLFVLPHLLCPQDRFAKFHAKQGLKLFVFSIICDALSVTGFGAILTLLRLYLIYKGMSNALNGRMEPLPWIGGIGEN